MAYVFKKHIKSFDICKHVMKCYSLSLSMRVVLSLLAYMKPTFVGWLVSIHTIANCMTKDMNVNLREYMIEN